MENEHDPPSAFTSTANDPLTDAEEAAAAGTGGTHAITGPTDHSSHSRLPHQTERASGYTESINAAPVVVTATTRQDRSFFHSSSSLTGSQEEEEDDVESQKPLSQNIVSGAAAAASASSNSCFVLRDEQATIPSDLEVNAGSAPRSVVAQIGEERNEERSPSFPQQDRDEVESAKPSPSKPPLSTTAYPEISSNQPISNSAPNLILPEEGTQTSDGYSNPENIVADAEEPRSSLHRSSTCPSAFRNVPSALQEARARAGLAPLKVSFSAATTAAASRAAFAASARTTQGFLGGMGILEQESGNLAEDEFLPPQSPLSNEPLTMLSLSRAQSDFSEPGTVSTLMLARPLQANLAVGQSVRASRRIREPASVPGVVEETLVPGTERIASQNPRNNATRGREDAKSALGLNRVVQELEHDDAQRALEESRALWIAAQQQREEQQQAALECLNAMRNSEAELLQRALEEIRQQEVLEQAPFQNNDGIPLSPRTTVEEELFLARQQHVRMEQQRENDNEPGGEEPPAVTSWKQRLFSPWRLGVSLVCLAIVLGLGVTFATPGGRAKAKMDSETIVMIRSTTVPTAGPTTPQPTLSPTQRTSTIVDVLVRARLEDFIPAHLIAFSPDSFELAVQWYVNDDPNVDRTDNPTDVSWIARGVASGQFLQRFILAWVWFHSTNLGRQPWISCNPKLNPETNPSEDDDDNCLKQAFLEALKGNPRFIDERAIRYMSSRHECEWAHVLCANDTAKVAGLSFVGNGMTGPYPIFITLIPTLKALNISYNDVTGPFPTDLSTWTNLTEIWHEGTLLTGPVPDELYDLTNLERLILGQNNELSGTLSTKLGQLFNVVDLRIFRVPKMHGRLPTQLGHLAKLQRLQLSGLNLALSPIPTEIGALEQLNVLDLSLNSLSGGLPMSFVNLTDLQFFDVSQNRLRGRLPDLYMPSAMVFSLYSNLFSGDLPDSLYSNDGHMEEFWLHNNFFDGTISEMIGNFRKLKYAKLSINHFSGGVPKAFGSLSQLTLLSLGINDFEGAVPDEICALRNQLGKPETLTADCGMSPTGTEVEIECSCCTLCCHDDTPCAVSNGN